MTSDSIERYRARDEDAPLDLVAESPDWKPVIELIGAWAKEKVGSRSGYSTDELDYFSKIHGIRFPRTLREWWRLAGRHPLVQPGLLGDNAFFLQPHDRALIHRPNFLAIAVDDMQTWCCNGIHADFLTEPDPPIHGINGFIGPADAPRLTWYKEKFIATGLRVPALIFTTLLYHLFEPSPLVRDEVVYLEVERHGLLGGQPDDRLVSTFGLHRFPNDTNVGDIYSDGKDIIYWWLRGCACRNAELAQRLCQTVPAHARRQ